ncbi:hypothetical protein [Clostridium polynesiense]|uniref:hypothetical protein n=1 Tax=Clostridium polynesiense TaxID=1325933 RepID=UPI000694247A|nr:hypothetical protein [Clostridium polynesiense]
MKITREVIQDLIPLVKDGVASEDSIELVKEHAVFCENCKEELESISSKPVTERDIDDVKIIKAIKRSMTLTSMIILIIGSILGIAMTNSFGMFYNFLIMPVLGAIGVVTLKNKVYLVPVGIFILSYFWQFIQAAMEKDFYPEIFYGAFMYSGIYTFLVLVGILIGMLLKFAFRKEE